MRLHKLRLALLLTLLLCLQACGTVRSEVATSDCAAIPLVDYTRAQQAQAADELDVLTKANPGSELAMFVGDYGKLRAMVRACQAIK